MVSLPALALAGPSNAATSNGQSQFFCFHVTMLSSTVLPRPGAGPPLPSVATGERWCQVSRGLHPVRGRASSSALRTPGCKEGRDGEREEEERKGKKLGLGSYRVGSAGRSSWCFIEVVIPIWWLATICNSSSSCLMLSSDLCGHQACMWCTNIHVGKIFIRIKARC